MLSLEELARESSMIDCPGEIIAYNCSILSNTENLLLTWIIDFPENLSLTITYDIFSFIGDMDDLGWNVTTTLTYYTDDYIESKLEIMVPKSAEINRTKVECRFEDLDFDTITVYVILEGT